MGKLIRGLGVLLLIVSLLSGCGARSESGMVPLTTKQSEEIRNNFCALMGHDYTNSGNGIDDVGLRYYGTYNDYIILFRATSLDQVQISVIGNSQFTYGSSFVLYAYKDETFYKLGDIYEEGFLSEEDISNIAEHHAKY